MQRLSPKHRSFIPSVPGFQAQTGTILHKPRKTKLLRESTQPLPQEFVTGQEQGRGRKCQWMVSTLNLGMRGRMKPPWAEQICSGSCRGDAGFLSPRTGTFQSLWMQVSRSCRGARASTALTTVKLAQPDWDPALPARGWLPKRHHGFHVIGANTSNFFPSGKSFLQFRVILNYTPSFGAGFDHSTTCCPLTTSTGTAGIVNLPFYSIFYFISFFQAVS